MLSLHKTRCSNGMLTYPPMLILIFASFPLQIVSATTIELPPLIPKLCDTISCPAESEIQCPEDSSLREDLNAVDLIKSKTVTTAPIATTPQTAFNSSQVSAEVFAQCCLAKKCICKTCYIQDCNKEEGEVVVELQPDAMDTPGQCCGTYQCMPQPNCTEVRDTSYYWLQHCQRCHCTSGAPICHQSCDEDIGIEKANAICESKNLNSYFQDGMSWKDGCYECECVKGEEKCVIPFCGNVNCPTERQVIIKDTCCPVCWPHGEPMPHEKPSYDDGYGDYNNKKPPHEANNRSDQDEDEELPLPPLLPVDEASSILTPTATASSPSAELNAKMSSTTMKSAEKIHPPPSSEVNPPDLPDVVIYYRIAIALLVVLLGLALLYIWKLRAKQRSYRPVSNFDDKV
ncbi:uncharacterized protein LOC115620593 [Scaptodrosophila lebanonensis]|uniref:Uncharacterized protein LOC115620593 n=1 Tax=Drosophila lebanonensis TaxID=7225 RepID=A0A6J2T4F0_DROLE|nr:uncharacterized protein LOC115620593 [Scaptodrosophila lebanonensis]